MNSRSQRRNRFAKELKPILFLYCVLPQNIWLLSSFIFSIFIHILYLHSYSLSSFIFASKRNLRKLNRILVHNKIRVTFFGTRIHLHLSTISHSALLLHPNLLSAKGLPNDLDDDSDSQYSMHVPTHQK